MAKKLKIDLAKVLTDNFHKIIDENIVDGNLEEWEKLIQKVIRSKDESKNTALHKASEKGNLAIVKYLIEKRAQLGAKNGFDSTPLHNAATNGTEFVYIICLRYLQQFVYFFTLMRYKF